VNGVKTVGLFEKNLQEFKKSCESLSASFSKFIK
jgi:hypothetical protein